MFAPQNPQMSLNQKGDEIQVNVGKDAIMYSLFLLRSKTTFWIHLQHIEEEGRHGGALLFVQRRKMFVKNMKEDNTIDEVNLVNSPQHQILFVAPCKIQV